MTDAGVAYVDVQGKFDTLEDGVAGALARLADKFGSLGGIALPALGIVAGAAIAAGAALYAIGDSFSKSYDTIRVQTGATGTVLKGLEQTFNDVVRDVPTSFGNAATAISILHDRLGLVGQPLENLSDQVLELSRIMKTDLNQTAQSAAAVMNNWGISTADQGPKLDELFRAAQRSGVGINDLMDDMSTAGPQLRTVGLNFEQSASMIALLNKNGISTGPVFMSLSHAIALAVKNGQQAPQAFQAMISAIQQAPNATAAAGIAITDFGSRAGPKLAALIREGKFSYQQFAATLGQGDTIRKAGRDTDHLGEALELLKNKLMVDVEPIAMKVFNGLGQAVMALPGLFDSLSASVGPPLQAAFSQVSAFVQQWWPTVVSGFDHIVSFVQSVWPGIEKTIMQVFDRVVPGLEAWFGTVENVVTAIVAMFKSHWPQIEQTVRSVISDVEPILTKLASTFSKTYEAIEAVTKPVLAALVWGWQEFGGVILSSVEGAFHAVATVIGGVIDVINGILDIITGIFTGDWSQAWNGIKEIFSGVWQVIEGIVMAAWNTVYSTIAFGVKEIEISWHAAWSLVSGVVKDVWDLIKGAVTNGMSLVVALFTTFPGKVLDTLGSLGSDLFNLAGDAVQFLWNGWVSAEGWLFSQLLGFGARIISTLSNLASGAMNLGEQVVEFLWNGFAGMVGWISGQIAAFASNEVRGLGIMASDAFNIGVQVVQFLWTGWQAMVGWISGQIGGFISQIVSALRDVVTDVYNIGIQVVQYLWNGIQALGGWIVGNLGGWIFNAIIAPLGDLISEAYNIGSAIVSGMWNGFMSLVDWITSQATSFAKGLVKAIKGVFGISSPSTVFAEIGENLMVGLANGVNAKGASVQSAVNDVMSAALPNLSTLGIEVNAAATNGLVPQLAGLAASAVAVPAAASTTGVAGAAANAAGPMVNVEVNAGSIVTDRELEDLFTKALIDAAGRGDLRQLGIPATS